MRTTRYAFPQKSCWKELRSGVELNAVAGSGFALPPWVNCLFWALALSLVTNASAPSFQGSWASSHATLFAGSAFRPQASFPVIDTLDVLESLQMMIKLQAARGRGKWNGWMATDWLRLKMAVMGGSHAGVEFGATAILSRSWISPTFTIEAGQSSGGDAFSRTRILNKSPYLNPTLIRGFSYDYQAAYLGLELGAQNFAISFNVGMIRAENSYQNMQSAELAASNPVPGIQCTRTAQVGPAAKLALLIQM